MIPPRGRGLTTTISYDSTSTFVVYTNAEPTDSVYVDDDGQVIRPVTLRLGRAPVVLQSPYGVPSFLWRPGRIS